MELMCENNKLRNLPSIPNIDNLQEFIYYNNHISYIIEKYFSNE